MKKFIVNADDFGLHPDINRGIIKGHQEGFITSTSLMCSGPAFGNAVELAQGCPNLGIGIHLTLVGSVKSALPASQVSTLVDENGLFPADYVAFAKRFYSGAVDLKQMEAELRAQLERGLSTGLKITHIDSHQHTHVLPIVNKLVLKLCYEYNISSIRIPEEQVFFNGGFQTGLGRFIGRGGLSFCAALAGKAADAAGIKHPQHFFGMLAGGNLNAALVGNIIRALPEGVSELMTHPGLNAPALGQLFDWHYHWEDELGAYLSKENKELLKRYNVELINFGGL